MKIALAQLDPVVGDIAGNTERIGRCIERAEQAGADMVVFSELSVLGYPPGNLLLKERFVADSVKAVERLAARCGPIWAIVGFVRPCRSETGGKLENAAAVLQAGRIRHVHVKTLLPTYGVFEEARYFQAGRRPGCIEIAGRKVGLMICEDPVELRAPGGAEIIVNMAASPYQMGKASLREELLARQAERAGVPIAYVNQVGGNDELVFDGGSCLVAPDGQCLGRAKAFAEDLLVVDPDAGCGRVEPVEGEPARLSAALELGIAEYVAKCGFSRVVLGLSGGIDSAVVATLAAEALGPANVTGLAMPSRHSSQHSTDDARLLAENLGINFHLVPIEPVHAANEECLKDLLASGRTDIADENIQARIRGSIVMAYSNAFGDLPLATGNKSELSVGYCTLYGDMCGGLAPIADVLKTVVYQLAEHLNATGRGERIPCGTFTKAPSAELKPGQFDQDELPPYEVLDKILAGYVEGGETIERMIGGGLDAAQVRRIVRMVDAAEYKRRQAPPALLVASPAFGVGAAIPVAQRYVPAGED